MRGAQLSVVAISAALAVWRFVDPPMIFHHTENRVLPCTANVAGRCVVDTANLALQLGAIGVIALLAILILGLMRRDRQQVG